MCANAIIPYKANNQIRCPTKKFYRQRVVPVSYTHLDVYKRQIRAALEAILDYGRPKTVELLVLVDRGHRELPIHGDYVGRKINTARSEKVNVLMEERDGRDEVVLESADA